jgi:UDP-glucose 4-epimerase
MVYIGGGHGVKVLVTGGLGFIGSHTVHMLLQGGHQVLVLDNLSNSKIETLDRINSMTQNNTRFIQGDVLDDKILDKALSTFGIEGVVHFAALKSVKESIESPERYHLNNVVGTERLISKCLEHNIRKFIFSSSAAVYGSAKAPVREDAEMGEALNPYGSTKVLCEELLKETHRVHGRPDMTILRYFNVAGAHPTGNLGEDAGPDGGNLMSHIIRAAGDGKMYIYGDDYDTPDGTAIRDYIHVMDVARGHILALERQKSGINTYNLGTGKGTSVLGMVNTFQEVNGVRVSYEIVARRKGDVGVSCADPSKALDDLGWRAELSLGDMVRDSWNHEKRKLAIDTCI